MAWKFCRRPATVLAVIAIVASSVVALSGSGPAAATMPGQPGTPQPGTPVFAEDFSSGTPSAAPGGADPVQLQNYTGGAAANGETYTADPAWLPTAGNCNGWILNSQSTNPSAIDPACNVAAGPDTGGTVRIAWYWLRYLAYVLGLRQGQTEDQAENNNAVAAMTNGADQPAAQTTQLATVQNAVQGQAGHYYVVTAYYGAVNCNRDNPGHNDPSQSMFLLENGTPVSLATGLNPCTDPDAVTYNTRLPSAPAANPAVGPAHVAELVSGVVHLTTNATLGFQLDNNTTAHSGNDVAFDLPTITDVTPQLDKVFSPTTVLATAQPFNLTFTITNTDELGAKPGWTFQDALPEGVQATAVAGNTCSNSSVTDAGGGALNSSTAVQITGDLLAGQASCTVTLTVIAQQPGAHTNDASNVTTNSLNPPGSTTVTVLPDTASIELMKSASPASYTGAGQQITFTYTVKNTGNETLTAVQVTDTRLTGLGLNVCQQAMLNPGDSFTCSAPYITTQADVDNGSIINTATATGVPLLGTLSDPHASASVTVPGTQTPAISIVKDASTSTYAKVGTVIDYTYRVANTGNVTLHDIAVTDSIFGQVTCPADTLGPTMSMTCSLDHTVTQPDLDAGSITDTATVTAMPPAGLPSVMADSNQVVVTAQLQPSISVSKTPGASSFSAAGTVLTYTYRVTNTGNETLDDISLTDTPLGPVTCPSDSLDPGENMTCTATYTTTQADLDHGSVDDMATVSGTGEGDGMVVTDDASATVPADQLPGIAITKSASPASFDTPGQVLDFTYRVTNTGNVTLTHVDVSDAQPGLSPVTCDASSLAVGASTTCHADYTVTQPDLDAFQTSNTGIAIGTPPTGPAVQAAATAIVPADVNRSIEVIKDAAPATFTNADTTITYTYTVTNNGNVTLHLILLTDDDEPVVGCPTSVLAPGQSMTCRSTHDTTQADVDAGGITNTAQVTAVGPQGHMVSDMTSHTVPAVQHPEIELAKTASRREVTAAGQTVTYTYTVTNTGNVTLHSFVLTDNKLGTITCPQTMLPPGTSTITCTATYTVTQADMDAGQINNQARITAQGPDGTTVDDMASASVAATQTPGIMVTKTASVPSFAQAGTPITYRYVVTDTGNVTLTNIRVTDSVLGAVCTRATLQPGATALCTATTTTDAADVAAGGITNTATATGTPPSGPDVTATDTITVPQSDQAAIGVLKTATPATITGAGTVVTYHYLVTNAGQATATTDGIINDIALTDDPLGTITCPRTTLDPAQTMMCTATATITQAEVDAGQVTDTATVNGTSDATPLTDTDTLTLGVPAHPRLTLTKQADPASVAGAGTRITYTFTVRNTGNVTLRGLTVRDPLRGLSANNCAAGPLAPGASRTCTASYTTTQADVNRGSIRNTATVTAITPGGGTVTASGHDTVRAARHPAITLTKTASRTRVPSAGTRITYTYRVTNSGNVTLHAVHLADDRLGAIACPSASFTLAPGRSTTCRASYVITGADVDRGQVTNHATATGTTPGGSTIRAGATATVHATQRPRISVLKSANVSGVVRPGIAITYQFLVRNIGNVTLRHVRVVDTKARPSVARCPDRSLAPGAVMLCSARHTTTQADVDQAIHNVATARGRTLSGEVSASHAHRLIRATRDPNIALVKTSTPAQFQTAGTRIVYHYRVTNTGNTVLNPVTVSDAQRGLSPISCDGRRLEPGASLTCRASFTTTQADVRRGVVNNDGVASGLGPNGVTTTAQAPLAVLGPQAFVPGPGLTGGYGRPAHRIATADGIGGGHAVGTSSGSTARMLAITAGGLAALVVLIAGLVQGSRRRYRYKGSHGRGQIR